MEVGFKIRSVNVKILLVLTYTEKFNVSFETEMKNQLNAKMQTLSDTGLPYYLTSPSKFGFILFDTLFTDYKIDPTWSAVLIQSTQKISCKCISN